MILQRESNLEVSRSFLRTLHELAPFRQRVCLSKNSVDVVLAGFSWAESTTINTLNSQYTLKKYLMSFINQHPTANFFYWVRLLQKSALELKLFFQQNLICEFSYNHLKILLRHMRETFFLS